MSQRKRIVIIGAGFGGLYATRTLSKADVDIVLIDRNNYHTFTPLLYQVATCAVDPSAIAYPIRSIVRNRSTVQFLLGEVKSIDVTNRQVLVATESSERTESYDYLLVAGGSITNTYGIESIQEHGFGLKDLNDAILLRQHILKLFEQAAWTSDDEERNALLTLVVVGGGPTGLETAGALYELYNYVLKREYNMAYPLQTRVVLLEAMDHILGPYPKSLRNAAVEQLDNLGVEVMLNAQVSEVTEGLVRLKDGRTIRSHTLVWSAGVKASPLASMIGVPLASSGRIPVDRQMQVLNLPENRVFAAGDITYLEDEKGKPYPMLIPVAKQQGMLAARNMLRLIAGEELENFRYIDRGIMATIGRRRAVAWIFYKIQLTGFLAWLSWLFLHLVTLIGVRNRIVVFLNWVWNYLTYDRSVRIILNGENGGVRKHSEEVVERDVSVEAGHRASEA